MANNKHPAISSLPTLTKFSYAKLRVLPEDAPAEAIDACTDPLPPEDYAFIRDGRLFVNGENGHDVIDYYGEYRGGYPYIDPRLEEWATKRGGFWEWENAACIYFCK
jgi:hypothetical protein